MEAYVSCQLIPLDKNPGVRPIGVGEVLRRVAGNCIGWVLKDDIQLADGPLQTATGLQSGAVKQLSIICNACLRMIALML